MSSPNHHTEFEEVHQVIGDPPHWLIRSGISLIAILFILVVSLSLIVKYPDELVSRAVLVTPNPPIRMFPKVSGQVDSFFVQHNDFLKVGDLIAMIKNPADLNDVQSLEDIISTAKQLGKLDDIPNKEYKLGALQNAYSAFKEATEEYVFFTKFNGFEERERYLDRQIKYLTGVNNSLLRQQSIVNQQVDLAQMDLDRNDLLFRSNSISTAELERVKSNFLRMKGQLESLDTELISNGIRIQQLSFQTSEIRESYNGELRKKELLFRESISKLESEIILWKQQYLISAPISGKVLFGKVKAEKQFVNTSDELVVIEPIGSAGPIIARTLIKGQGIGKVSANMKVIIQLDGYPYQEYGSLIGTVSSISSVPQDDGYFLEIGIPQDLSTTYNKQLPFIQEMQGTVRIVTENRSIAARLLNKIYSVLKNRI